MHALLLLTLAWLQIPGGEPAPDVQGGAPAASQGTESAAEEAEPRTPGEWVARVDRLVGEIRDGTRGPQAADALFPRLDQVLRDALAAHRGAFRGVSSTSDPLPTPTAEPPLEMGGTVAELFASLRALYTARLRLLGVVSPRLRAELTGTGIVGVHEFWLEVECVGVNVRYQRVAIPDGARALGRRLRTAPVPTVLGVLIAAGVLVVLRYWRRWAKAGLPQLRELTRRAWRSHAAAKPFGTFLWYLDRTRTPLEWFAFSYLVFGLFELREVHDIEGLARIVVFTVLMAWFLVNLADAIASRPSRIGLDRSEQREKARLRSLWIVAVWALVLVLGLRLSLVLAGRGTLYAWVWHLFELLIVPVVVLLVVTWRPVIRKRLEGERRFSNVVARLLERRGPVGELGATVGGMAYLLALDVRRLGLRLVRRTALGRTLVAEALRQTMDRDRDEDAEVPELDADLRKRWLRGEGVVESAVADELREVLDMLSRGWRTIVLIGERGGGKSTFLAHLATRIEGETLMVSCPHGGAEQAIAALFRALELDPENPTPEALRDGVRARGVRLVAWDDLHRICHPVLGGQAELNRLLEFVASVEDVPALAVVDSSAWEYIRRVREGMLSGASTVVLSAWTEEQIGELLETRAREVGMELDYGGLAFPRLLLEEEYASPEEGVRASYRRILWAEADGNPEVALRLVVDHLIEKEDGDGLLLLPHTPSPAELGPLNLVELLVLRFLVQTDGATSAELVDGLRYPEAVIESVLIACQMRGLLEENHGRYRLSWTWFRTITRVLTRRNMLGSAKQKAEHETAAPRARAQPAVRSLGGRSR